MRCAWESFVNVLPLWMRSEVDRVGRDKLEELRLRMNAPPELILNSNNIFLNRNTTMEDIRFCINAASRYSPWAAESVASGYLTVNGGHRIGICGDTVIKNGTVAGFREIHSINIRIARDVLGAGREIGSGCGSLLIIGAPGWGKTTLLRDVSRNISEISKVSVVDERGELFPPDFQRGKRMDVITGCPKKIGIEMVLRSMGPEYIVVDEITAQDDCRALLEAIGCGVRLLATAHATSREDLMNRPIYQILLTSRVFDTLVVLRRDRSFTVERMTL